MLCTIWYHFYDLKNVENIIGGVLFLENVQALALYCTNGTKSHNASHDCYISFPAALKLANITHVFKNPSNNYRPVSISSVSKINESLLFNQINDHFEDLFSKYQFVLSI